MLQHCVELRVEMFVYYDREKKHFFLPVIKPKLWFKRKGLLLLEEVHQPSLFYV